MGVAHDLQEIYGINIPLGAIESILKRMAKHKLVEKKDGEYIIQEKEILQANPNHNKDALQVAFQELLTDIKEYAIASFGIEFSHEEIESGLITFLKENDVDLLFAQSTNYSPLPRVKESKKAKYIIARFITHIQSSNQEKFLTVLKLAKGHAIASLITYEDLQYYSGNLDDVEIYLDAPIIFNLLGLNSESNLMLTQELIEALKAIGAKLRVFEVNHDEVVKTIEDAIRRINTNNYEIAKSSRVLRTAIREKISAQQLRIKLHQLETLLVSLSIDILSSPSLDEEEYQYQIDEPLLSSMIAERYKREWEEQLPDYKLNQISRDVNAISSIFKIRKRARPSSLKNCKAVFLTSNETIASVASLYEKNHWEYGAIIPVCMTDIFLSTILWANYPSHNNKFNVRQLICECYSIMELDNRLLNRFYEDIKRMHQENTITNEQFYLLNASNLTYSLLEQKTLNDIDEYTDKTPSEILEDLQMRLSEQLNAEKVKNSRIDSNIRKIAAYFAKSVFFIIAIILMASALFLKSANQQPNESSSSIFIYIVFILSAPITIFGFLRWMEFIPTKSRIESSIEEFALTKLKFILHKD